MACLLALAITATVLMVQSGQLTFAARTSPAEAFWRAVLPDAPMPDAIFELLHAETNVPNGVKANDDDPPAPVPPMNFNYDDYSALPRSEAVAAPSSNGLSRPGVRNAASTDDIVVASSSTVFFLEDVVRVGESLPFRSFQRAAEAPAALASLRLYTVRAVRAVEGSSFVVCRDEAGPSPVYGCRATGPARAYVVDVAGERGDDTVMTAAAVCHTDTSRWDPEHAAFRLLGLKPGGTAVCHAVPHAQVLSAAKNEKGTSA